MKKKSTPKKSNNITHKQIAPKKYTCRFRDNLAGGFVSWNSDYFDNLALKLANWAWDNRNNYECLAENAITLQDFYNAQGMCKRTFYKWVNLNENLREAKDFAIEAIGAHRERGGLFRKMDPTLVAKTMAKYDSEERKLEKWRTNLKAKVLNAQANLKKNDNKEYIFIPEPKKPIDESTK
jgi:hypothetical protein